MSTSSLFVLLLTFLNTPQAVIDITPPELIPTVLPFRLQNKRKGQCLKQDVPEVRRDGSCDHDDESYWTMFHQQDDGVYFKLRSKAGYCLYDEMDDARMGGCNAMPGSGGLNSYLWKYNDLQSSDGSFRLKNKNSLKCLSANNNGNNPKIESCTNSNKDRYWNIIDLEGFQMDGPVQFALNAANIIESQSPISIGSSLCINDAAATQVNTQTLQVSFAETHSSSFSHTAGWSITAGYSLEVSIIPEVVSGTVEYSATASYQYTWGESRETSKEETQSFTFHCAPGERILGEAVVWRDQVTVPYTINWKSIDRDIRFETSGTWRGVSTTKAQLETFVL